MIIKSIIYLLNVGVERGAVAALDLVARVRLPVAEVLVSVEHADMAQVVRVALAGVHGVGSQFRGLVLLQRRENNK